MRRFPARGGGGQPGHRKAFRALVPPEELCSPTDCKPDSCRRRGRALRGEDPNPLIHQVADLPRIEPLADEYRLHRLTCLAFRLDSGGAGGIR